MHKRGARENKQTIEKGMNMVSYSERQKLLKTYRDEPVSSGLAIVFKCAACLMLVVLIASIGVRADGQTEMRVAQSETAAAQR